MEDFELIRDQPDLNVFFIKEIKIQIQNYIFYYRRLGRREAEEKELYLNLTDGPGTAM